MRHPDRYAAFEQLLRAYGAPLRRLAHAYTRGARESEDLLQEVAIALWTALPRFRGESSERTWLYRIAHNTAIRFTATRSRRARHEQPGLPAEEPAVPEDPERDAIAAQQRARLWAGVRALPLADRQVLTLHLEGLSTAEIAVVTGVSPGNAATRLTRARQKLVQHVNEVPS